MEALVGRGVRKDFPGFGTYAGIVDSYDPHAGYFLVLYEDGDSEEVDLEEVVSMLVGAVPELPPVLTPPPGKADGRQPKKRCRRDEEPPDANGVLAAENGVLEDVEPAEVATPVKRRHQNADEEVETEEGKWGVGSATQLRRSARQAKAAKLAAQVEAAAAAAANTTAIATPQVSRKRQRRSNGNGRCGSATSDLEEAYPEEVVVLKPELPASSKGLDLDGLPVLDLFAVYSCLRSFGSQLFLSPFRMEMFVAALRSIYVNPLIDWVHFSLLTALKSHLEVLANEGDPSAIHCIRNLNWGLLDLATWPVYLAEYLLTRGSELRSGITLTDLKLFSVEYYRQPAVVKLELLRLLCDDVLEIELIRSELSSRIAESDLNDEGCRSTSVARRKRGSSVKSAVDNSPPQEGSDDVDDRNSDECYLCGMDGNLLCCDGCPAAFHSKCVGVVEDLLPEGDWYCPECFIERSEGSRKLAKPSRGAEVLGTDPHGRLYFGSCGYLLVAESCDAAAPCHYYDQIDLNSLVTVLKSCHTSYSSIVDAISEFWGITTKTSSFNSHYNNSKEHSNCGDDETACRHMPPLEQNSEHNQVKIEQDSQQLGSRKFSDLDSGQLNQEALHRPSTLQSPFVCENGNEIVDEDKSDQISEQISPSTNNDANNPQQDGSSGANGLAADNLKGALLTEQKKTIDSRLHLDPASYMNYYSFGQMAASVAEELRHKLSENKEGKKPTDDAASLQLKTVCKKYASICSLTQQKLSVELLKEKCGWCNSCKITGGGDCIFRVIDGRHVGSPKPRAVGLRSEKNKKNHVFAAMHHILSIEERVNGLLSGPWQNPQYSNIWRKTVLKASDVPSLKQPLLMLESNLRRVAFSVEWQKPADSVEVVGSAAHILVRSTNKSARYASARKQGRKSSAGELKIDSRDVGVYWWRGGILSRQVFHWKRLPQPLAHKAGRQAGCKKIPSILYPDGSEFARRYKHIAWQAAVEMTGNVAQLILQIKELESNIKWSEILGAYPSNHATKESLKIAKLFKKVIIRRKCTEGTNVKYLLDFGNRANIPPVVGKHGIKLEEPSSERKRYWLSEGHVPLNLLKAYEAKALTRSLKKKDTNYLPEKMSDIKSKKPKISQGLSYLLEKARKLASRLCGQCNKEVITSEAVNCQYCEALFHKKHFKVPRGASGAVYVCNKCLDEKVLEAKPQQKKTMSKKASSKKKKKKQSQNIVTKRNHVVVKVKKKASKKKSKQGRPKKKQSNVPKNGPSIACKNEPSDVPKNEPVKRLSKRLYDKYMNGSSKSERAMCCRKRKRTALHYSYWLDGLQWTKKSDDERAISFRKERVVFPSENVEYSNVNPVCCLCKKEYDRKAIYIACEKCEDWFHGDIYSITLGNINNLIGFKCNRCRLRSIPVCPYLQIDKICEDQSNRIDGVDGSADDADYNSPKELEDHKSLNELEDYNSLEELDNHKTFKELENHKILKELNNHGNSKEVDGHDSPKELENHKSLNDLEDDNSSEQLDNHKSLKELDNYNILRELNNHDSSKEADGHNSPKELDGTEDGEFTAGHTHTEGFLDEEQFNVSISGKEALIMTSETGSVKGSVALQSTMQSTDHPEENSIPDEHDIGLQVVVTL